MKSNELMLGDLVLYKDMYCIVTVLINGTIVVKGMGKEWYVDCSEFSELKPIPLTVEILEKNGFVKQWNNNWQFNDNHSIIISKDFYIEIFELSVRLDYVHELQHALRFCGIEKEIVL